jgi:hypothetical protein
MALKKPYRHANYMGEYVDDAAALAFIQAQKWDADKDGTGLPEEGMWYLNTSVPEPRIFMGGVWQKFPGVSTETVTVDIDFTASDEEDEVIDIGRVARKVLRGRLYIDEDPGSGFSAIATVSFYSKAAKKGEDVCYRAYDRLVYTELEVATTGSDANITPDDHTDFVENGLALVLDTADEFVRLATVADTMVAEDTVGAHPINAGLVRVVEFFGVSLMNLESGTNVYLRIGFAAAQTVSLKLELVLES